MIQKLSTRVRVTAVAGIALGAVLLTGCGSASDANTSSGGTTTTSSSTSTSSQPASGDPVIDRLRTALDAGTFGGVLARSEGATASKMPVAGTDEWTVYDLRSSGGGHPQRLIVALDKGDRALVLSGNPDNVSTLFASSAPTTAAAAAKRASEFLELGRVMSTLSYQVDSTRDIRWLKTMNADQKNVRDEVEAKDGKDIAPPKATPAGNGWKVVVWRVEQDVLQRHDVTITADGVLSDRVTEVRTTLPVVLGV